MDKQKIEYSVNCRICKTAHPVVANADDVCSWQEGALIQDAMPYLSADDRELLISGTCGDCWVEMFGVEDDYYDSGIDF